MDPTGSPLAPSVRTIKTRLGSPKDTLVECSDLRSEFEGRDISRGPLPSSEGVAERGLNVEEGNTFRCMYQVHLTQHACVWDGIARVNEEILLTMLDIFEKHKSKCMWMCVCTFSGNVH